MPLALRALFLCVAASVAATAVRADDVDTLFARFRRALSEGVATPSQAKAAASLSALRSDGTWPDVDLSLTEQVNWTPRIHLDRIASLAKAYATPGHVLAGDAALLGKLGAALDAYLKADPVSTNWWYNEIGAQLSLAPIPYLLGDRLTAARRAGCDSILARSWRSRQRTGENLVWISRITCWRAALDRDGALLDTAAKAIAGTIAVTPGEGIQADFSFHQHGAQLYNGGYGSGYASDACGIAADFGGTRFAFPKAKIAILSRYLLDGQRWMTRGGVVDHSVRGREITRSGAGSAGAFAAAAKALAPLDPDSAAALAAFAADIGQAKGSSVDGARMFWRSEYLAAHRPAWFVSVRMASSRLQASEVVNQEGLLSTYLADGATLIYRTGHEYDGIFPVWDWSHIPGATTAPGPTPAMKNPAPGSGSFAGGASLGRAAVAAFAYDKAGVKAAKAWFMFDDCMVALGAGISAPTAVHTTVNQCLLKGPVLAGLPDGKTAVIAPGGALPRSAAWILQDRVGYVFAGSPALGGLAGPATGSWKRINAFQSADPVSADVFALWIDHGTAPANAAYAYAVLPDADSAATARYARAPEAEILANSADVQAVRHGPTAVTGIVFRAPGSVRVTPALTVAAARACVVLAREGDGSLTLTAADPARGAGDLRLTLGAKLAGPGAIWSEAGQATAVTLPLPQGDSAGAAVTRAYAAEGVAVRPVRAARAARKTRAGIGLGSESGWRYGSRDARGRAAAGP
jgi:chondroitin AC lyase